MLLRPAIVFRVENEAMVSVARAGGAPSSLASGQITRWANSAVFCTDVKLGEIGRTTKTLAFEHAGESV